MCDHCQGRFLKGMSPVESPQALLAIARELRSRGGSGLLVSGGCDAEGRVPLAPYLPTVREIRAEHGLMINLHPGLVSEEADALAGSMADRISFDLVLDQRAIRERVHLNKTPDDYLRSFHALRRAAPGRVAPHILLGLGDEENELRAVREACHEDVPCLVLLSLMGLEVRDRRSRLLRAVQEGVDKGGTVLLGCMRPRGDPITEIAALEAGAEGIACPDARTLRAIGERGWKVDERPVCCALHR